MKSYISSFLSNDQNDAFNGNVALGTKRRSASLQTGGEPKRRYVEASFDRFFELPNQCQKNT
jgi:hypothetical protein